MWNLQKKKSIKIKTEEKKKRRKERPLLGGEKDPIDNTYLDSMFITCVMIYVSNSSWRSKDNVGIVGSKQNCEPQKM